MKTTTTTTAASAAPAPAPTGAALRRRCQAIREKHGARAEEALAEASSHPGKGSFARSRIERGLQLLEQEAMRMGIGPARAFLPELAWGDAPAAMAAVARAAAAVPPSEEALPPLAQAARRAWVRDATRVGAHASDEEVSRAMDVWAASRAYLEACFMVAIVLKM